jgi:phage tail-like protein
MPLESIDPPSAVAFTVTIDGIALAHVVEVSGLKAEVDIIELKQQTPDGKYVIRQLIGRPKAGQFTVTRGLTESTTVTDWIALVMRGEVAGARKAVEVSLFDSSGSPLRTFSFSNCWVQCVEMNGLKRGGTEAPAEVFVVCYDAATTT